MWALALLCLALALYLAALLQETRMLSQALNHAMSHSRNQLEGVNRKELMFYLAVQLLTSLVSY